MRYAILADIHSNLAAFERVLEHAQARGGFDAIWCLGDVVGYGPDPQACIDLLRQHPHLCVAGNHDWAAIGKLSTHDFNPDARAAALWTGAQLSPQGRAYLEALPERLEQADMTLVHGSPRWPIWEYLLTVHDAEDNYKRFAGPCCLVGHSHVPLAFVKPQGEETRVNRLPAELPLLGGVRFIVNPGGVGQPRDGDPRASYALYDDGARVFHHFRVPYEVAVTQRRMIEAGLPRRLVERLAHGW